MTVGAPPRTTIPRTPLLLGLAGLVPFWGLALALGATPLFGYTTGQVALALVAYGAVIVSFLGGIRWGIATVAPQAGAARHYEMAVVPSLLAWAALALSPALGLATLGVIALALGWRDQDLVTAAMAPPWYGRLRLILSGGAGAALLLAAALCGLR